MEADRFDVLTRKLTIGSSRRGIVRGLSGLAFALPALARVSGTPAKKKRKKKLRFNELGCINAGQACRGNDALCCSGICEGERPRKGRKDRSNCVGHNQGICTQGQNACAQGFSDATECSLTNSDCACGITTGNAGFCGNFNPAECVPCRFDTECETFGFPAGSACVRFAGPACGCSATGERACVPPCA